MSIGCDVFLASMVVTTKQRRPVLAEIPIISEFSDVLSNEMPSFPPAREVGFVNDLVSDTTPIFRELYDRPHLSLGSSRHSYRSCWIRG